MTKSSRQKFIQSYVAGILADFDEVNEDIPKDWTGDDLRKWVADRFIYNAPVLKGRQLAKYSNDVKQFDLER